MRKTALTLIAIFVIAILAVGCSDADVASKNLSKAADQFEVQRRIVFYNGKSIIGWFLVSAGILIILGGVIANLRVYFAPTSLYNTLAMLGMIAIGVGLVARSVREHEAAPPPPGPGRIGS